KSVSVQIKRTSLLERIRTCLGYDSIKMEAWRYLASNRGKVGLSDSAFNDIARQFKMEGTIVAPVVTQPARPSAAVTGQATRHLEPKEASLSERAIDFRDIQMVID